MILTDHTIIYEMNEGNIKIEPYNPANLGTNSYDLTLANTLVLYTERVLDVKKKNPSAPIIIPAEGIVLQPNMLYLASTVEYTETLRFVPIIQGKSSLGRLGLWVHVTAGFGDVGFKGHWTLELVCVQPIRIYAGMKIAQLVYNDISEMPKVSYDKKESANYLNQGIDPQTSKYYKYKM